jgi:hypothetical protein
MIPKRLVAYHEAGHAAVHVHFGHRVERVMIQPIGESAGHVEQQRAARYAEGVNTGAMTPATRLRLEEEILGLLAGQYAIRRLGIRQWRVGAEKDDGDAFELAGRVCGIGAGASIDAFLKWCRVRTEMVLARDDVWSLVEVIATQLLREESLSRHRVLALVRESRDHSYGKLLKKQGASDAEIRRRLNEEHQLRAKQGRVRRL